MRREFIVFYRRTESLHKMKQQECGRTITITTQTTDHKIDFYFKTFAAILIVHAAVLVRTKKTNRHVDITTGRKKIHTT